MSGCFGKLFKRGKSLPPGGTQVGKNAKNNKNDKKNNNVSMPSIPAQVKHQQQQQTPLNIDILGDKGTNNEQQANLAHLIKQRKEEQMREQALLKQKEELEQFEEEMQNSALNNNIQDEYDDDYDEEVGQEEVEHRSGSFNYQKNEEDAYDPNLIVPAPKNFRGSKSLENEEFSSDSRTSSKYESDKQEEVEFLNNLNIDLQNELKESLSRRSNKELNVTKSTSQYSEHATQHSNQNQNLNAILAGGSSNRLGTKQIGSLPQSINGRQFNLTQSSLENSQLSQQRNQNSFTFKDERDNFMNQQTNLEFNQFNQQNVQYNQQNVVNVEAIQKIVENLNTEANLIEHLKSDNKNLKNAIDDLKNELVEREKRYKQENDLFVNNVHNTLSKDIKSESEKQALSKLLHTKQQEANERLIKDQSNQIEQLKARCQKYENTLKQPQDTVNYQNEIKSKNEEISILRQITHRLNIELSAYQARYPSGLLQASLKKKEITGLPPRGPIPIWLINTKYLSPLLASYDEKLNEKSEKMKLLKKKIDDLTNKFKTILDENSQLHSRLEKGISVNNSFDDSNDINKIKHHAMLVLEENKALNDQLEFQKVKMTEIQKQHIHEIGNLSKRIIVNEAEKNDLKNQNETLKLNHDEILRKHNDLFAESQRRVALQDHLNKTGDLKRKLGENEIFHKHEIEHSMSLIHNLEGEKKELSLKISNLSSENKKLTAENQVLDSALNEGIGRKTQRKIKELERRIELAEIKEKTAYALLEKLTKEAQNIQLEKETFENMVKGNELQIKKLENKLTDENLKIVKLETKFQEYKQKSASKLAELIQKLEKKDSEFTLIKLEGDKKVSDVLNLLHKKQDEIDVFLHEKRQLESELEMVWVSTTNENRRMKEALLESRHKKPDQFYDHSLIEHHKLLLDD